MERLTKRIAGGQAVFRECSGTCGTCDGTTCPCIGPMVDRLAEYEDTGTDPGDILSAADMAKVACALHELNAYKNLGTLEHLRSLIDAEKSGRIIVLPCKVGDTVYRVIRTKDGGGHIAPAVVSGIHMADTVRGYRYKKDTEYIVLRVDGYYCDHVDVKKFGKTVFLTQEEARAALHNDTPAGG